MNQKKIKTNIFLDPYALFVLVFIIIITSLVYYQVKKFDFVNLDDQAYVYENIKILEGLTIKNIEWSLTAIVSDNWHPITLLSHMADCHFFGLNAGSHHMTNVFFHIANTFLLFFVLWRMTGEQYKSIFVAALFSLHPLHVESVAWISERKDVLSTFFLMLTIWGYIKYFEKKSKYRYLLVCLSFVLGLMAKPMIVTLPFVLLLLDLWPLERIQLKPFIPETLNPKFKITSSPLTLLTHSHDTFNPFLFFRYNINLIYEKLPLFAIAAASCIITYLSQKSSGAVQASYFFPFHIRILNALVSYKGYLQKMIWPSNLAVYYPHAGMPSLTEITTSSIVLISLTLVALFSIKRRPYVLVGWLWYLGTLVPVIGIVQVGGQAMADRYTYIPLIGIFIAISWGVPELLSRWQFRRKGIVIISCILVSIIATLSYVQVDYWNNSISLFGHALAVTKDNWLAHHNLGCALESNKKNIEICIKHFSESVKINPNAVRPRINLARLLSSQNRFHEAIKHCLKALELKDDLAEAHFIIGNILWRQKIYAGSIIHLQRALELKPDYLEAHINIGSVFKRVGKFNDSLRHFYLALQLNPNSAGVHNNIGNLLEITDRTEEAIKHYDEALKLDPDLAEAHNNLGAIMMRKNKIDKAIRHYKKALENNNISEIHKNLGDALLYKNNFEEAIFHYKEALRIRPDFKNIKKAIDEVSLLQTKLNLKAEEIKNEIKNAPQDAELLYQLGNIYKKLGKSDNALLNYQKAHLIKPNSLIFLNSLATLNADLNNYDQSIQYLEKMIQLEPEKNKLYYNIACLYAKQNKTKQSIEWLEKAIDKGYKNLNLITTDEDLENIRNTSEYKKRILTIMESY